MGPEIKLFKREERKSEEVRRKERDRDRRGREKKR
jgi:hypothetical protein